MFLGRSSCEVVFQARSIGEGAKGSDDVEVGFGKGIVVELFTGDPGVIGAFDVARSAGLNARKMGVKIDGKMAISMRDGDEMGPDFDGDAHFLLELAGDALRHGFAFCDFAAGEFPEAGKHAAFGLALGNEDLIFCI